MPIDKCIVYKSDAYSHLYKRKSTKMKEFLAVISLLISGAVAEPPAPYAPSGWRPSGPSFDLPQRGPNQQPQNPRYLPPLDPRNNVAPPEADVSVQGLPQSELRPLFQASPITGQEYTGPAFNQDLRTLDERFQQSQYQAQQERYREYQRQKQLESQPSTPAPTNPRQFPRTEAPTTQSTKDLTLNQGETLEPKTQKTTVEVTKQNLNEYPGELFLSSLAQLQLQPQFLPLQVSKQYNQLSGAYIQPEKGYDGPAHFSALPSVLAQQRQNELLVRNEQPVLVQQPISQFAQAQVQTYQPQPNQGPVVLQAPAQFQPNVYLQPNPDAVTVRNQPQPQFIAQPVAFPPQQPNQQAEDTENIDVQSQNQQQNNDQQFYQRPIVVPQFQPQNQYNQPQFVQPGQPQVQFAQPGQTDTQFMQSGQPQYQFMQPGQPQTQFQQPGQFPTQFAQPGQPDTQFLQPGQPQYQFAQPGQPQTQFLQPGQPQTQFPQPQNLAQPEIQYLQPQFSEPQNQYGQPQLAQPGNQYAQPQAQFGQQLQPQSADLQNQYLQPAQSQQNGIQNQYLQPQTQYQPQNNLQSGLDINQDGNDIEEQDDDDNEGATAVATAFGTRTQPRVNTRYGDPFPVPKVRANPTTTESAVEEVTEEGPAVAQAVAVANGERRKSSKLRTRRVRPVYALDRSGRLVLAES